jgi:predicted MPP superfamily phosphohydrolase
MKKNLVRILILILLLVILFLFYKEMSEYAVKRVEVDASNQAFANVPKSFDQTTIVFFSDVHYNKFMDKERLLPFIETINQLEPDIVLFGGDLYDHPSVILPSDEIIKELTTLLKSIDAPLGKYAVLGNHDHESTKTVSIVRQTLEDSGFEVLVNEQAKIYNSQLEYISIVGVDSQLFGDPDIEMAFVDHNENDFTIVLSHTPDLVELLDPNHADWQLSGHSHGGQVALPLIGPLYKVPYAEKYTKQQQTVNGIQLNVSNGVGTTRVDMRLFANPQIHYYTLIGQ